MRRKQSSSSDNDDIADDATPVKLRLSPPNSRSSGMKSRYEIDHGSCDYKSGVVASNDGVGGGYNTNTNNSNSNTNHRFASLDTSMIPPPTSSSRNTDSPCGSAEGLHHRNRKVHPVQQLHAPDLGHPLAQQQHYSHNGNVANAGIYNLGNKGYSSLHGNIHPPRRKSCSQLWKRLAQCCSVLIVAGYLLFLYMAKNRYDWNSHEHRPPDNQSPLVLGGKTGKINHGTTDVENWRAKLSTKGNGDAKSGKFSPKKLDDGETVYRSKTDSMKSRPVEKKPLSDYAFRSVDSSKGRAYKEPSTPAFQRALEWSKHPLSKAKKARADRLKRRRQRTTPPFGKKSITPLWYKLEYDSEGTISSVYERWASDDSTKKNDDNLDTSYALCGSHAVEAAKHHPQNYFPPNSNSKQSSPSSQQPLGPQSRVLISGILTPLGLHLAIALHRRCNVTNFMGLDSQFPNDPLSRLEMQERLAVLMQELENVRRLEVPFLGLELKNGGIGGEDKKMEWRKAERKLAEISEMWKSGTAPASNMNDYAKPYQTYGIPLSPGTAKDGSGPLSIILDYRPTHIVHLSGTQSDSLFNSNYHSESHGDDVVSPSSHNSAVFLNKGEEEEDILKESISGRPHLYDLRMGVVGMEQLLSGVVAQTMLPPKLLGQDVNGGKDLSDGYLAKMKQPHVVYASSYDALHFRNTASRLNQKSKHKKGEDEEVLGGSPPSPKRPSRGLHGASRLIDEILASSYSALHNIPSIGLRFDAIYGPRGFGVPSTSVPIFHVNRIKRTKRGVSPDVDLAETAVRSLYRRWTDALKEKEEEEGAGDYASRRLGEIVRTNSIEGARWMHNEEEGEEEEEQRRRLGELNLIEEAGWMHLAHDRRDFVFVEDAVGAIISAMQYKSVNNSPTTFNIGSGEMSTLSLLANELQELASPAGEAKSVSSISKNVIDVERSSAARAASRPSNDYLRWSAKTSLKDGAAKLLAWHLDRALSFFPPASLSDEEVDYSSVISTQNNEDESPLPTPLDGEGILSKRGISSCSIDKDPTCLRELHTSYPCSSECSTQSCLPSVFDGVLAITHEATEDCDVVLYTMVLGYDVENMGLETEYSDGEEQEAWMETTICTIAFVPSESTLVKDIIDKVPPNDLLKRGAAADSDYGAKVKRLNGYLAHKGWVLILVDDTTTPLTPEDMFLPKLSPARLFHSTVRKAMFVDENFSHTPYPEDAQFLASETSRGVLKKRTVTGPDAKGRKTKYKLPQEPQRRAVLLVSPMRNTPDVEGHKMPLNEITMSLMEDTGLNPDEDGVPKEIQAQREYYERSRSLINSMDLRSLNSITRHKLEIKDFIRSKWIIHHLKLEEGHQLRCEWYREHVRWGTHLDQLSFSYVMAKRELARKTITRQPMITETEELTILQKIINIKSDAHEWHPIFSAEDRAQPIHHSEISPEAIPLNLQDLPDNEIREVNPDSAFSDAGSTFYVRIMSDERMLESRKKWMKARNNHRQLVAALKEKEAQEEEEEE